MKTKETLVSNKKDYSASTQIRVKSTLLALGMIFSSKERFRGRRK
jgi:hypothetical protein